MKFYKVIAVFTLSIAMISCNQKSAGDVDQLATEIDSVSYALGLNMGRSINADFKEINTAVFNQGFRNGVSDKNKLMDEKDINVFLNKFFMQRQAEKREKELEEKFGEIRKAGEKFLAENKSKEGVVTTDSGLQYMVLKEGNGPLVQPENRIKIHYHGTTIDGEVFDSTVEKNKPYENKANIFIPGFNEGLALMKEGAKYRFFIPQELAYGTQQRGELIKPFSALIFEVEVLDIIE